MLNVTARQDLMRTIVETVNVVVEEARLDFSENGLEIRVVDPSHVAMIQMKIDSAAFDTWDVSDIKLGLEIKKLKEMVSLAAAGELIHLNYSEDIGNLTLNIGKIDRNIRPLDNSTLSPPNLPKLELPCEVKISGDTLAQAFRAAMMVGDLVNLSIDDNKFVVSVSGGTDSVVVEYDGDDVESISCDSPTRSQYSLTYLIPLAKVFNSLGTITLQFGENLPLRLTLDFDNGADSVEYSLAPRVEGDR